MKVVIAFLTKDRVELSERTLPSLIHQDIVLFWIDGSTTAAGRRFLVEAPHAAHTRQFTNVGGGADAAIVFALTRMLDHSNNYTHVGLCENDVLLHPDWFAPTLRLFDRGAAEGLHVGAVSPRCYADRVLVQRDGYAVVHNLGAGIVIFSREAARLVLDHYRTAYSTDNRTVFNQLCGHDIGRYWAFRGASQWLTADWGFDTILARAGLASLALTPSPVEMIGQNPPLHEQGLKLVTAPVELLRNDQAFATYRDRLAQIWRNDLTIEAAPAIYRDQSGSTIFPHQIGMIGGQYDGGWELQWTQGFGPFSWRAGKSGATVTIPVSGPCTILVSGGKLGGQVEVADDFSGYSIDPMLNPEGPHTQILGLECPCGVSYREIRLTAVSSGVVFYGLRTAGAQLVHHKFRFDYSVLPPAASLPAIPALEPAV